MDDLNLIKDGLKLLFQANKELANTMDAKITLQQEERGFPLDFYTYCSRVPL